MQKINYNLFNDPIKISVEIELPTEEMALAKWQEVSEELMGQKVSYDLVSEIEQYMAQWVITQISVTSDFEVK